MQLLWDLLQLAYLRMEGFYLQWRLRWQGIDADSLPEIWELRRRYEAGEKMFRHAVNEFVQHYHAERNHQGLENKIIHPEDCVGKTDGEIARRERLGGLLKYYHRRAA